MRFAHASGGVLAVALSVSSCAVGNAASRLAKAPDFQPKDQTKCGVTKSQAHPLIVEWPSADRLELESKVRHGLVAVHYVGCEMSVLERCSVAAKYNYVGGTRKEDELNISDEDDLYANLPVGAARLEGKLQRSGKLTVKMNLVGRYEAERTSVSADELEGDCQGATHLISGVTLGAFDFYASGKAEVGGHVGIVGVGGGGHSLADRENISKDGDPDACAKSSPDDRAPPPQCGALIRVEVVPLRVAKAFTPTCPDGTQWDGSQCAGKNVFTQVKCPGGSKWDGTRCAAAVSAPAASLAQPTELRVVGPGAVGLGPAGQVCVQECQATRQQCRGCPVSGNPWQQCQPQGGNYATCESQFGKCIAACSAKR